MRRLQAGWLFVLSLGCIFGDPILVYRVPNWRVVDGNGRWYEREIDGRMKVSVHNSGFGGTFSVTVQVLNLGSQDLTFDGSPMSLVDSNGTPLPDDLVTNRGCGPGGSARLAPGASLEFNCGFAAKLRSMPREIVVVQPGFVLEGRAIPLAIPMTEVT